MGFLKAWFVERKHNGEIIPSGDVQKYIKEFTHTYPFLTTEKEFFSTFRAKYDLTLTLPEIFEKKVNPNYKGFQFIHLTVSDITEENGFCFGPRGDNMIKKEELFNLTIIIKFIGDEFIENINRLYDGEMSTNVARFILEYNGYDLVHIRRQPENYRTYNGNGKQCHDSIYVYANYRTGSVCRFASFEEISISSIEVSVCGHFDNHICDIKGLCPTILCNGGFGGIARFGSSARMFDIHRIIPTLTLWCNPGDRTKTQRLSEAVCLWFYCESACDFGEFLENDYKDILKEIRDEKFLNMIGAVE